MARSRPHPHLCNSPLRRQETNLGMDTVAKRLVLRSPAAAQCDGRVLGAELVSFGVEQQNRALHQVRSIVQSSDLRVFGHGCPPRHLVPCAALWFVFLSAERYGYEPPLQIACRLDTIYSFLPNLVSSPTSVTAATACIKANVPADDPVAPAKAIGTNERSRPTAATPQKTRTGRRVKQ